MKKGAEGPCFNDLQNSVKVCRSKFGAGDESRTRDLNLGKVALYQLSYSRICTACLPVLVGLCNPPKEASHCSKLFNVVQVGLCKPFYLLFFGCRFLMPESNVNMLANLLQKHNVKAPLKT